MTENKKTYLIYAALIILSLIAGWFGVRLPAPPIPDPLPFEVEATRGLARVRVTNDLLVSQDLDVGGSATVDGAAAIGGALAVTGNASVGGTLGVTGVTTLGGALIQSSTAITLTAGQQITPAYGLYLLSSSGAVSMTLTSCAGQVGQIVYLYGDDANNITINDSNVRTSSGNALTLGQYDLAGFICRGTEWIELFLLANS